MEILNYSALFKIVKSGEFLDEINQIEVIKNKKKITNK